MNIIEFNFKKHQVMKEKGDNGKRENNSKVRDKQFIILFIFKYPNI